MQNFDKYLESLDEGKIVLKRRYTENHPEKNVRKGANIRNTIIEALRDKKLTLSEFNEIVAQHSKSPNKWTQRNKRFFTIKEDNVTLSRYGNKIAKTLQPVNEAKTPKMWDSQFTMNAIEAYKNNEFDLEDDKSIADWDKKYNGGRAPKPAFNTKEVVSYAIETGKKPNGEKMDESIVTEKKVEPGKYSNLYYDTAEKVFKRERIKIGWALIDKWLQKAHEEGHLEYTAAYVRDAEKDIRAAIDKIGKKNMKMFAYESVEINARAKATQMLKDVTKGFTTHVEGIKLSKEMAEAYLDWLKTSAYGKRYVGLPFEHIFKASFNWGIDRYTKHLKKEYKELKQKAKEMKESTIYTNFSNFVNESYLGEGRWTKDKLIKALGNSHDGYIIVKGKKYIVYNPDGNNPDNDAMWTDKTVTALIPNDGDDKTFKYSEIDDFTLDESVEINEALKSSKLRNLLSMKKSPKDLFKAIYGATKIALDKVEDHQVVDIDPKQGPKQDGYVFYYTTQEKENPHAPDSYYNGSFPANTLLALAKGKKVFYVQHLWQRRGANKYSLTTDPKGGFSRNMSASDIGPNKSYSGYDASGLGSLARVISIADAAFVVNPDALETTHDKIEQRVKAKEGAIAFQDPKEFKNTNLARYKEILTQRSESLDVDKEVEKAINDIAEVMKEGIKNKKRNRYGEVIMGTGQDGRDYKMNDLTNFTTRLMDDYQRWSGHMADVERAKEALKKGDDSGSRRGDDQWEVKYYTKQALEYAKEIKDRLRKLKKKNLAW